MLTARGDERDELQGFNLGVDEYISKPFSPKILVARVNALLRRSNVLDADEHVEAGGIVVDKAAHQVQVDGKDVELSYKEFELSTLMLKSFAASLEKRVNTLRQSGEWATNSR